MTATELEEILDKFNLVVIPAFSRKRENSSSNGVFDPPDALQEKDEWKNDIVLETLEKTIMNVEAKDFKSVQHLFFPPVVTLVQDHQVKYKMMGIDLIRVLRGKSQNLKDIGLNKLFLKELSNCLTWHSNPELVQLSMDGILDFVTDGSKNYPELENVVHDILRGLVYSLGVNDQVQVIFLNALCRLIPELGILASQFTKSFIVSISDILLISTQVETTRAALQLLKMVLKYCWLRIPKYKGMILASLTESYLNCSGRNVQIYQQVLVSLQDICGKDALKDDLALLSQMGSCDALIEPLMA